MSATVEITEFWRVGRRADPLHVDARYQGGGRFDDPERLVAVLYGAPTLRTCLLEFLLPWPAAPKASTILTAIPTPTNEEEAADAEHDRLLAAEPRRVPSVLYERVAIRVRAEPDLTLLDLREVAVRERLGGSEAVARELRCWSFTQLDRGALLAPYRPLTQAIVGAALRGPFAIAENGLFVESRHEGAVIVIFRSEPFSATLTIVESELLMPANPELIAIISELGLLP